MDGGEAMLEGLRALGVEHVISSPGSEWGAFWEAIARQSVEKKAGPKYLSCWHETLAANVALGYTMASGRMQAVVLHAGVGLLQGSVGLHAAYIQNMPMLVFSGESLTYGERAGLDPGVQWYQNLSVVGGPQRMVEPYVKWAGQAGSVETLYETVVRGGHMAQRTPMGPVYVNVPIETQLAPWKKPARPAKAIPFTPPRAPVEDIERVAQLLADAREPVIVAEGAGREPEGYAALVALAEALSLPVIEPQARVFANFPREHALHQGSNLKPFHESADLILLVRCRGPWYPPANRPPNAKIVVIDEDPYRSNMVYQRLHADVVLEGDAVFTLNTLTKAASNKGGIKERLARHAAGHKKLEEARAAAFPAARMKKPIDPAWVCAALSETLPADTVYVDEAVTHRGAINQHLMHHGAGSYLKVRGGLGQGIGHALGARLALPNRPIVALLGDGGFLYNPVVQCLGFAAQTALPVIIVIFNNGRYRSMRDEHRRYYPDGVAVEHDLFVGEKVGPLPDLSRLGDAFGCWGKRIEDPRQLAPAIQEAFAATKSGRTAILDVIVDP
jgi:thiamine pyrophosphate-dependent acetolactate synthase large subunit-like protein